MQIIADWCCEMNGVDAEGVGPGQSKGNSQELHRAPPPCEALVTESQEDEITAEKARRGRLK